MIKNILCILFAFTVLSVDAQKSIRKPVKPVAPEQGVLYFSLLGDINGKPVTIVKDFGRTVYKDSLKTADRIMVTFKVGKKVSGVKDIRYDAYFLSDTTEPVILMDLSGLNYDASIWRSCVDSLLNGEQVVIEVREITLDDGTKVQNPKLAKENKATYIVKTSPNFPPGGWDAKAKHWIAMWRDWFKLKDNNYYRLDDKKLELYANGIVYTIFEKPKEKDKAKKK